MDEVVKSLEEKENDCNSKAVWWSRGGTALLAISLAVAILFTEWSVDGFEKLSTGPKSGLFGPYLVLRGTIMIALLAAWSKYAFKQAAAYKHEALKRSERTHAIKFGKMYLEIYRGKFDMHEFKAVFEHWNINPGTAFQPNGNLDFEPKMPNVNLLNYPPKTD